MKDGCELGWIVGWHVGCVEGWQLGWLDGWVDGSADGCEDGCKLGCNTYDGWIHTMAEKMVGFRLDIWVDGCEDKMVVKMKR